MNKNQETNHQDEASTLSDIQGADSCPLVNIEVAYALPARQYLIKLSLPEGSSVKDAIDKSGILERCKEIDLSANKIGIYSRPAKLHDILQDGERVEIYRPLLIDPKEWRRQRAERMKK